MSPQRRYKLWKFAIVLACMLLMMTGGLPWYWGNISSYTLSYIVANDKSNTDVEAPWVLSMYTVFEMASILVFGILHARFLDQRWLVLAGVLITEASLFATYFAIQNSYFWLIVTMGIALGIGTGFLYANGIHLIVEIADKDMGLLTSLFQSSFTAGALIANKALTEFVNPNNESPELKVGSMAFFDQESVLDKVPTMYIIFGFFSLIIHVIGLLLLQFHPSMRFIKCTSRTKDSVDNNDNVNLEEFKITENIKVKEEKSEVKYDSVTIDAEKAEVKVDRDYSPVEMLKTPSFYILWFSFFVTDIAFFLLTNYYKTYGQIFIHDDYFLTDIGTALIFVSMLARMIWGVLIDRFGLKVCLAVIASSVVTLNFMYYFMPMINRYLYLLVTIVYGCFTGSLYNIYLAATAMLFGKKHASSNFSLILTAAVAFNLLAPVTLELLLTYFGWFTTFTGSSVLSIISLICILIFFNPVDMKKER